MISGELIFERKILNYVKINLILRIVPFVLLFNKNNLLQRGRKDMLIHKIDEEISLRMFNEGDSEEFYDLIISSKHI